MALFSRNKKGASADTKAVAVASAPTRVPKATADIITNPRLTEKTVTQGEYNVYTFVVRRDATKYDVRDAVKNLFKVTPVKVNIVNKAPATRLQGARGQMKKVAGMKKAYVYLKKGDTINLV
jgi:large subunit ribosomal protein L23